MSVGLICTMGVLGCAHIPATILDHGIVNAQYIARNLDIRGHRVTNLHPFNAWVGRATRFAGNAQVGALIDDMLCLKSHNTRRIAAGRPGSKCYAIIYLSCIKMLYKSVRNSNLKPELPRHGKLLTY